MELQLNSFVESFKLTSAENMAKQLKESKDDKDKMTETLTKLTRELEKIKGTLRDELFHYDGDKKIVIKGLAKADQNILDFISNLKKGDIVKNAIVKSMTETKQDEKNPSNLKNFIIDTIINPQKLKKSKGV